ncbi:MAG: hypothetical protein ACRDWA_02470 [Acidimicrobiia bacterium]
MVRVYAVALSFGVVALIAWIFSAYLAGNVEAWGRISPEVRFGKRGRQVVAGLVGFGMAGMSAEFSPRDLSWPISLVLAVLGAAAAAWYSTWIDRPRSEPL